VITGWREYLRAAALGFFALLAAAWSPPAQSPPPDAATVLKVGGQVPHPLSLSAADLLAMPRRVVETKDHDGKAARFEGVTLTDVLKAAGAPLGDALRGPQLSKLVLVTAADGYRVVFTLPELDPGFTDDLVLLADRRDGQPLAEREGPLRLVVPHEKRQARWVRKVMQLLIVEAVP
jgi:DMSO/TMAO reductase YedYZ molybdopterin-dependent catalytic subunit